MERPHTRTHGAIRPRSNSGRRSESMAGASSASSCAARIFRPKTPGAKLTTFAGEVSASVAANSRGSMTIARGAGVCDALVETYTVPVSDRWTDSLVVDDQCGGCAGCRPGRDCDRASDPTSAASASTCSLVQYPLAFRDSRREGTGSSFSIGGQEDWERRYARVIRCALPRRQFAMSFVTGRLHWSSRSRAVARTRARTRSGSASVDQSGRTCRRSCAPRQPSCCTADSPPGRAEDPETTSRLWPIRFRARRWLCCPRLTRSWERPDMTVREMYPAALRTRALAEAVAS